MIARCVGNVFCIHGYDMPDDLPQNLRNGPCGGVRTNGHCEVKPEMRCVWTVAFERATQMPKYGDEFIEIQPPVNRQLEGTASWVNMLAGTDAITPKGWREPSNALPKVKISHE